MKKTYKGTLFDLGGSVAVVTGGMGQLGAQFALALTEAGAKVYILDLTEKTKNPALKKAIAGGEIELIVADITKRSDIVAALARIKKAASSPTILVNNAALDSPPNAPPKENGPFEEYPESSWDKVMDVNLKGVFLTCQVIGGEMAKNAGGSIINISSIYGMVSPTQRIYEYMHKGDAKFYKPVAYSVSKSGVYNLTRYLAAYWAKKNVRVNTLTLAGVFKNQDRRFLENYCEIIPKGRMANEDEYNGAILFLASKASEYMTGSNLVMDGGWTSI